MIFSLLLWYDPTSNLQIISLIFLSLTKSQQTLNKIKGRRALKKNQRESEREHKKSTHKPAWELLWNEKIECKVKILF